MSKLKSQIGRAVAAELVWLAKRIRIEDEDGKLSWHISGIICEGHQSYNILRAMRADLIDVEDGIVREC